MALLASRRRREAHPAGCAIMMLGVFGASVSSTRCSRRDLGPFGGRGLELSRRLPAICLADRRRRRDRLFALHR